MPRRPGDLAVSSSSHDQVFPATPALRWRTGARLTVVFWWLACGMLTAMAGRPGTTHFVEIRGDVVVKRFRSHAHGEPRREWRALRMLATYAPGLTPRPGACRPGRRAPVVVMSRLGGTAMGK